MLLLSSAAVTVVVCLFGVCFRGGLFVFLVNEDFQNVFQGQYKSVKRFRSRSESKLFAKAISRRTKIAASKGKRY